MSRRQYAGGAKETTTTGSVASSGAVSITIADATGWPDASVGPFAVVIDPGTASEEKVLVTARVGLTLTVTAPNRGYDGTSAIAHSSGAAIYHTFTAVDFDEANEHINDTSAAHAASAISFAPVGTVAATTVQAAIAEVDSEKAAASHAHATSDITSFTEAVQDIVGTMFTDGTGIDSSYNDGAGTITVTVDPTEFASDENVRLTCAAAQTIPTGTITKIAWDTEVAATSWIAVTGDTLTVPAGMGGWYVIRCQVIMSSGTLSGQHIVSHGGSSYLLSPPLSLSGIAAAGQGTILLKLTAADTLIFWYQHGTGSDRTITANLDMVRVSM